jgi:alpha-beta hydrolase superfamily lysophospholipase
MVICLNARLATQPPAAVILIGHSMGGLLAAEAATDPSSNAALHPKPYRIIGLVAFDTPYLGMHPHIGKLKPIEN